MNSDADKMEKQEMSLPYEQPSLKKYGTIKALTFGTSGSTASLDVLGFGSALGTEAQDDSVLVDTFFDEENV